MYLEIPLSIRWEVCKDKIQAESKNENWGISSKTFYIHQCPGVQYFFGIRQRKSRNNYKNKIDFRLMFIMKQPYEIKANFKIIFPSANLSFQREHLYKNDQLLFGPLLCTCDELFDPSNNYFVNDIMTVNVEGYLNVQQTPPNSAFKYNYIPRLDLKSYNLGSRLWDRDDKDFAFIVVGKEIKAHKCIIRAQSPVFDRMIQSGMQESIENKVSIIDFDFEVVEIAIKYCYGIEIGDIITVENAVNILQFSDKYDIQELKDSMENFLISNLTPVNVTEIANASVLSNSQKLRTECFDFIIYCFNEEAIVFNLSILEEDFSLELLQASFSCTTVE